MTANKLTELAARMEAGSVLTVSQRRALQHLADTKGSSPSSIGQAVMEGRDRKQHRAAQGFGRIGGTVCFNLIKKGLAINASHARGGFPFYRITPAGLRALAAQQQDRPTEG